MRQSFTFNLSMVRYVAGRLLHKHRKTPMVLMLEPLLQCNLRCLGCGKVRQPDSVLDLRMSLEECFHAVEECGAPAVSIAGGEPLMLPDIDRLVEGMLERGKLTLLCTNGLLIHKKLEQLKPHPNLVIVFHADGLREQHDALAGKPGVFEAVVAGITRCKAAGFTVATNTTLYRSTRPEQAAELLRLLMGLGVDHCIVSPAFAFEEPGGGGEFLTREESQRLFARIEELAGTVRYYNTPMYMDFLRGKRTYPCAPWGNPTRDPQGWKSPCYLLTDRHFRTYRQLMERTPWEEYGYGNNPRCSCCSVHSGFEPSALAHLGLRDLVPLLRWMVR